MPDCMFAKIAIGGSIPSALVQELLQAIEDEDLHVDWDEMPVQLETAQQLLDLICGDDGPMPLQLLETDAPGVNSRTWRTSWWRTPLPSIA